MPIQEIEPITLQELKLLTARLERVAASLRAAEEVLKKNDELWVFRKKSMAWGIQRLEAVVPEIERSLLAHQAGQPYGPDTQKGREAKKATAARKTAPAKKTAKKKASNRSQRSDK